MSKGAVHFACVACGRCCSSPPQMAVEEALRLYDSFPLAVQISVFPVGEDYRAVKDADRRKVVQQIRDTAVDLGGLQITRPTGKKWVVVLCANALDPAEEPCPALADDGKCRIHQRRPVLCRAVPFAHEVDPRLSIRLHRQQYRHDCDWSSTAPVVMRDGQIVDAGYAQAYAATRDNQRRDSELLHLLWDNEKHARYDGKAIGDLIEVALCHDHHEERAPFIVLFEMMRGLERIGKLPPRYVLPSDADFYAAQANACIAAAKATDSEAAHDSFNATAGLYDRLTAEVAK